MTATPSPLFMARQPLVLASGSPRRRDMLHSLGLQFSILPSNKPEPDPEHAEIPANFVTRLAQMKGEDVAEQAEPGAIIIAADTAVTLGDMILGKPRDKEEALDMLLALAGKTHHVVTGCWLGRKTATKTQTLQRIVSSTDVTMAGYGKEVLKAYIETGEPMDKAGAYGIQGLAAFLVTEVSGSYTNVVGLPLAEVVEVLVSRGVIVPRVG